MHTTILDTYEEMDPSIRYESAKNIVRLTKVVRAQITNSEMDYISIIRDFESNLENKKYYEQKLDFTFKILELIDPDNQEDDILIDY